MGVKIAHLVPSWYRFSRAKGVAKIVSQLAGNQAAHNLGVRVRKKPLKAPLQMHGAEMKTCLPSTGFEWILEIISIIVRSGFLPLVFQTGCAHPNGAWRCARLHKTTKREVTPYGLDAIFRHLFPAVSNLLGKRILCKFFGDALQGKLGRMGAPAVG